VESAHHPAPMTGERTQLDRGSGASLNQQLIDELIASRLGVARAGSTEDGAVLELDTTRIAMTSDTFVVDPIVFGDSDIGRLAVCATVNDLAASGAIPRYLTLSLVVERGLPIADLTRVLDSARAAAFEADVEVVVGDARVVRGGAADTDKLLLSVAGIGEFAQSADLGAARIESGDAVIVTSQIADHGVHVLARRAGLDCAQRVPSDCAPLGGLVWNLLEDYAPQVRCMRELTRGGLAGVLGELADDAGVSIEIEAHRLPVGRETRVAAERLGIDPLHLPSAGSVCIVVDGAAACDVVELVRWQPQGQAAQIVGTVRERRGSAVTMIRPDGMGEMTVEPVPGVDLARLR
jgi:hydrogenase expression/formation protein HypE